MTESSNVPALVNVVVAPGTQFIAPGQQGVYLVSIDNLSSTMQSQSVFIEGLPEAWYRVEMAQAGQAFPGEKRTATVVISVPREEPAAERQFNVVVVAEGTPVRVACKVSVLAQPGSATPTQPPPAARMQPPTAQPPLLTLAPDSFLLRAGQTYAQATLAVENRSTLVERYDVTTPDTPPGWVATSVSEVRLEPGQRQEVFVRLEPRTGAGYPAGDYDLRIRLAPRGFPDIAAEAVIHLTIEGRIGFDARLSPLQALGRKGDFTLTIDNTGDVPVALAVEGADTEGLCDFVFDPHPMLAAGEERQYPVTVTARRNGLIGGRKVLSFQLRLRPDGGLSSQTRSLDARLIHKPLLGLVPLLAIVGVLALATFGIVQAMGGGNGDNLAGTTQGNNSDPSGGQSPGGAAGTDATAVHTIVATIVPTPRPAATLVPAGNVVLSLDVGNTQDTRIYQAFTTAMPWNTAATTVFNKPTKISLTLQGGRAVDVSSSSGDPVRSRQLLAESGFPTGYPVFLRFAETDAILEVWFRSNLSRSGFTLTSQAPAPNAGIVLTITVTP